MLRPRLFLDTSALFAAVFSPTGGARAILKLGELGVADLSVGPRVLAEADKVFRRKAPNLLPLLASLLAQANVQVGPVANGERLAEAASIVDYGPDAGVLAEALAAGADYFVTHDKIHFLDNPRVRDLPCLVGSAGDALAWLRSRLTPNG